MKWLELSTTVDAETAEAVSELFAEHGYNHGVVVEQPVTFTDDGCGGEVDPTRPVVVKTYLIADEEAPEKRRRIEEALHYLGLMRPIPPLEVQEKAEEDWANAWKSFYQVQRIGRRIVIVPSWLSYTPEQDDLVLELDPGMAFGTGLHPTTRLCLQLLEDVVEPGQRILDLGTGSGILAIAAASLGATLVDARDIDPVAVEAAEANVAKNGVESIVRVAAGSLLTPVGPADAARFDLAVANISANTIILLAAGLAGALRPGGQLIASGVIEDRQEDVLVALRGVGLEPVEIRHETDWVALRLRRPS
jgi:ribosomal protein L11 methyltransferase